MGAQNSAGAQNSVGAQNSMGAHNSARTQNSASTQLPTNKNKVAMIGPKEKLSKFNGDGMPNPIRHCKMCKTIWTINGMIDEDDWVRQFPKTLQGVAIDWFSNINPQKLTTWVDVRKKFVAEF